MTLDATNQASDAASASSEPKLTLQDALKSRPRTTPRKTGYELESVTPHTFPVSSHFEIELTLKGRQKPVKATPYDLIQGHCLTPIGSTVVLRGNTFHAIIPKGDPMGVLCKCGKIASYSDTPPKCEPGYCSDMSGVEAMFETLCLTDLFKEHGIDTQNLMREVACHPFLGGFLSSAILDMKATQLSRWDNLMGKSPTVSMYSLGLDRMSRAILLLKENGYDKAVQDALIKHLSHDGFVDRILEYFLSIHKLDYDWRDDDNDMTILVQNLVSPRDLQLLFASIVKTDPLKPTPESPLWLYLSENANLGGLSLDDTQVANLVQTLVGDPAALSDFLFAVNLNPTSPLAESFYRFGSQRNQKGLLPLTGFTFNAFSGPAGLEKARTLGLIEKLEALGAVHAPAFDITISIYIDFSSLQGVQPVYDYWYRTKKVLFSSEADLDAFEEALEKTPSLVSLLNLLMEVEKANEEADATLSAYNKRS